jgi:hypothetical protein
LHQPLIAIIIFVVVTIAARSSLVIDRQAKHAAHLSISSR